MTRNAVRPDVDTAAMIAGLATAAMALAVAGAAAACGPARAAIAGGSTLAVMTAAGVVMMRRLSRPGSAMGPTRFLMVYVGLLAVALPVATVAAAVMG